MKNGLIALALSLSVLPVSALADGTAAAPAAPTSEQRQTMRQALGQFAAQEAQLHQQMRQQVLSSLSPAHRQAIAEQIGQLAVAPSPDPDAAAKQIDALLTPDEQQNVLAAHQSFVAHSMQLHQQFAAQMQSMMPGHPPMNGGHASVMAAMPGMPHDAGTILLDVLSAHSMMDMMEMHGMGMAPGMGPMNGPSPAPPQP